MARFIGILISGVTLGVTLVFVIGVYGVKTRDGRGAADRAEWFEARTKFAPNFTAPKTERPNDPPQIEPVRAQVRPAANSNSSAGNFQRVPPPPAAAAGKDTSDEKQPWMSLAVDAYKKEAAGARTRDR